MKTLTVRSSSKINFLECVSELTAEEVDEDDIAASDADYMVESFESMGYTAEVVVHNCKMARTPWIVGGYGSSYGRCLAHSWHLLYLFS